MKYVGIYHYEGAINFEVEAENEEEARRKMEDMFYNVSDEDLSANLADGFLESVEACGEE